QQSIKQARGKTVAPTDAIVYIELAFGSVVSLALNPGRCGPGMAVGRMHFAQAVGDDLKLGIHLHRISSAVHAEALLQVFFVAYENGNVFHDAAEDGGRA